MTPDSHSPPDPRFQTGPPPELVDNIDYGSHRPALEWLAEHYAGPLNAVAGYLSLEGLDALAKIAAEREPPTSLLMGATPEALAGPPGETVATLNGPMGDGRHPGKLVTSQRLFALGRHSDNKSRSYPHLR